MWLNSHHQLARWDRHPRGMQVGGDVSRQAGRRDAVRDEEANWEGPSRRQSNASGSMFMWSPDLDRELKGRRCRRRPYRNLLLGFSPDRIGDQRFWITAALLRPGSSGSLQRFDADAQRELAVDGDRLDEERRLAFVAKGDGGWCMGSRRH